MKKIIVLVLLLTFIVSGIAFGAEQSDKPVYVTNNYFTKDIGNGVDDKHETISVFKGSHYIVYNLILLKGQHHLYVNLMDNKGNLVSKGDLGKINIDQIDLYDFWYNFEKTPDTNFYIYDLYDSYNGTEYFIDRSIVYIPKTYSSAANENPASLTISSPAFNNNGTIPVKYTSEGKDISPALNIGSLSDNGKTMAIIVDDPDAPGDTPFVHWLIWNIPITDQIPEAIPNMEKVNEAGTTQGVNDFGVIGYKGPYPPSGETHTYRFNVYILDISLNISSRATVTELRQSMEGHILQQGLLKGKYSRKQ